MMIKSVRNEIIDYIRMVAAYYPDHFGIAVFSGICAIVVFFINVYGGKNDS